MRKLTALLLAIFIAACLCACSDQNSKPQTDPPEPVTLPEPNQAEPTDYLSEQTQAPAPPATDVEVLNLSKAHSTNYQWDDTTLLALSEYSTVKLWLEDAARYPELAQRLEQLAAMQQNSMEDEYDNLLSFAREELDAAPDYFETNVSRLDVQVRRADTVAISLLSDSWSDFGWIEDFRGMHGTNFDAATGKELKITDVIKDMDSIPAIVLRELNSHIWAGDFYSETAVSDYFRDTPADGISWTLDYNGVTFYFGDGDLAEPGNGRQTATVDFARYPELFEEKYMTVPDAYAVELPLDHSFFADLNGDGDLEELNCSGVYDREGRFYTDFGIYTDTDGYYHYEELFAYGFTPYYVKTAEGRHYLYIFCEESESAHRQMMLVVFDVNGGKLTRIGEMNAGPAYIPSDIFVVPTDPNHFYLDDFDSLAQDAMPHYVGTDGMPVSKEDAAYAPGGAITVSSPRELLEAIGPDCYIIMEPGYYNLSDEMEAIWSREGQRWNDEHPYAQLRECFDGVELVVQNVDGFVLAGGTEYPGSTELVIDPRYGAILNFESCSDISLFNLTMGHTNLGECGGNVLNFNGCQSITLNALDVYGCGYYGIGAHSGTGELYAYECTIRDCAQGPLEIYECDGRFAFWNCTMIGSESYAWYEAGGRSALAFYECTFGVNETSYFMFLEDVYTENCIWSDDYIYPEYGYDPEDVG